MHLYRSRWMTRVHTHAPRSARISYKTDHTPQLCVTLTSTAWKTQNKQQLSSLLTTHSNWVEWDTLLQAYATLNIMLAWSIEAATVSWVLQACSGSEEGVEAKMMRSSPSKKLWQNLSLYMRQKVATRTCSKCLNYWNIFGIFRK